MSGWAIKIKGEFSDLKIWAEATKARQSAVALRRGMTKLPSQTHLAAESGLRSFASLNHTEVLTLSCRRTHTHTHLHIPPRELLGLAENPDPQGNEDLVDGYICCGALGSSSNHDQRAKLIQFQIAVSHAAHTWDLQ